MHFENRIFRDEERNVVFNSTTMRPMKRNYYIGWWRWELLKSNNILLNGYININEKYLIQLQVN